MPGIALVGAGGHAKVVHDCLAASQVAVLAYADPRVADWLKAQQFPTEAALLAALPDCGVAIGFVGNSTDVLARRLEMMEGFVRAGRKCPAIRHPSAIVSPSAMVGAGVQILPGAVINANASLGTGAVINTRAIVEHDAVIGAGAHIAPGAVVLGGASVGACSLIGAGAVVLPGASVPAGTLIPAVTRAK